MVLPTGRRRRGKRKTGNQVFDLYSVDRSVFFFLLGGYNVKVAVYSSCIALIMNGASHQTDNIMGSVINNFCIS